MVTQSRLVVEDLGQFPLPAGGSTAVRWQAFAEIAAKDLSVIRIVEGHFDAVAILNELGGEKEVPSGLLGVWAARPEALVATRVRSGWILQGSKPFCSGSTLLDGALLSASTSTGPRLFLVEAAVASRSPGTWAPLGMRSTRSETLVFDGVRVDDNALVGGPGGYVERPGFGHGGCGVAACWWGGANALLGDLRVVIDTGSPDLALAAYARAALAVNCAGHVLREAASQLDGHPQDMEVAAGCAAMTRCTVAEAGRVVLAIAARHLGTSVLGGSEVVAGRVADLTTYLTQHREVAAVDLGRRLLSEPAWRLC